MIGAVKSTIRTNIPAPSTSAMSIIRSLKNGRGVVTPHAVFIPFRTAPNTAEDAQTKPKKLAIPVIVLALTMPSMVEPINSLDTGSTLAICWEMSDSFDSGPIKNPNAVITAKPSGNMEKRA